MKSYLAILGPLMLASCASGVSPDYKLDAARVTGLVIGSITYESSGGLYRIGIVPAEPPAGIPVKVIFLEVGSLQWNPFVQIRDNDLGARGGTFAVEVPAGNYKIALWSVAQGPKRTTSTRSISIPFSVEPGRAIYLGAFNWSPDWNNISLRDQSERDIPILRARLPTLKNSPIVTAIARDTLIQGLGGEYRYKFATPIFIPIPIPIR